MKEKLEDHDQREGWNQRLHPSSEQETKVIQRVRGRGDDRGRFLGSSRGQGRSRARSGAGRGGGSRQEGRGWERLVPPPQQATPPESQVTRWADPRPRARGVGGRRSGRARASRPLRPRPPRCARAAAPRPSSLGVGGAREPSLGSRGSAGLGGAREPPPPPPPRHGPARPPGPSPRSLRSRLSRPPLPSPPASER